MEESDHRAKAARMTDLLLGQTLQFDADPFLEGPGAAHPSSRGMRVLAGRTCMDRGAPETLRNTAQAAPDQSKALLTRWHGVDRLSHVITPRFAPTSTPVIAQRAARAEHLWQALFPTIMLGDDRAIRAIRTTWVGGRPRLGR